MFIIVGISIFCKVIVADFGFGSLVVLNHAVLKHLGLVSIFHNVDETVELTAAVATGALGNYGAHRSYFLFLS
jgi:hypothetical protein